ncbi:P-loop NTPase family protein [endosymbiont of unidentified scaly snail isolate Monju]|uniref:hypothetical protein n=1 Tax=endosymbiont of unidentified scaly snail isolate Monju TaxID=1248727 RepID=UPI0003891C23|nr:hypothetical protein [endosymbiont of unidentified scaly snail isolate Monju]BAN68010.1 hypothetical protein EBS_0014 [endosymbiont of unidentified scaly snail isolate Monju]
MSVEVINPGANSGRKQQLLDQERLLRAKRGFSTRRFDPASAHGLSSRNYRPRAGDLVLAQVVHVGHHKRIEQPDGRRAHLFAGDEILLAYGNRYAPDQFEVVVPSDLGECDLVAAGGIAAQVVSQHRNTSEATRIRPLGVLLDARGKVLNLRRYGLRTATPAPSYPPVIAVLGTSMNAGKTTALSRLVLGLRRAGLRAEACKVTGTGAGGDYWMMRDAGAVLVSDFTDMGYATTHGLNGQEIEAILEGLVSHAVTAVPDVILLEVADGLLQPETRQLVENPRFRERVDGVVFAASDAMGAVAGAQRLQDKKLPLLAVTGSFTASPLAVQEVVPVLEVPVLLKTELSDPQVAGGLLDLLRSELQGHEATGPL